jgi:hypothetical protein
MAIELDKKSYKNPQNWRRTQRYIRIEHNKQVVKWFRVTDSEARSNLKNSLLLYPKDSASQCLVKMAFFKQYVDFADREALTLPLAIQTRVLPERAQLAVVFRPVDPKVRSGNYTLHIPHYNGNRSPSFSAHTKGNSWGKTTLKDGSSIMVYCSTKSEAEKTVKQLARYVETRYLPSPVLVATGEMPHKPFKVLRVSPHRADYYPEGRKNSHAPAWRHYF